jgi:hypothetical protein
MNMDQSFSQAPYNSFTQTPNQIPIATQPLTTTPYYQPINWQPAKTPSLEDRISNLERDLKEIKDILEYIKWRV